MILVAVPPVPSAVRWCTRWPPRTARSGRSAVRNQASPDRTVSSR
jgi:hypothetical protein